MTQQLLHVLVVACIMYILTSGFTFFIRLRGTADFSYMAIVIFGGFTGVILTELGLHPVFALFASFLLSIGFTLFVLHIIKRLALIYFNIGTFALYALAGYLVINLPITGASYGKSVPAFTTLEMGDFATSYVSIALLIVVLVLILYKTFFYKVLVGWGEHEHSTQALGVRAAKYTFFLIAITSFLAVLGANMYAWYFSYLSAASFWIPLLIILMATTYSSFLFGEIGRFLMTLILMYLYEAFRFAKFVDPSRVGYLREMLFAAMVMVIVFFVFRRVKFAREH